MSSLFVWSFEAGIVLLCLYLVYKWMFAGENHHELNRLVLLGIFLAALAAPFLPYFNPLAAFGSKSVGDVGFGLPEQVGGPVEAAGYAGRAALWSVLPWVYGAGVAAMLVATLVAVLRLRRIVASGEQSRVGDNGVILVLTSEKGVAPFSWWRYVVMSRADFESAGSTILTHELQHLALRHWADLAVAQVFVILMWYNPAAWLMREEFRSVHEYQADRRVLLLGVDARRYQMLLIKKAVGIRFQSLANSLNHSKLKKRITMMYNQKKTSAGRSILRGLALAPAFAIGLCVCNLPAVASTLASASESGLEAPAETMGKVTKSPAQGQKESPENALPGNATRLAEFPGGELEMFRYLMNAIKYPVNPPVEGKVRVVVQFTVNVDGSLSDFSIMKGGAEPFNAEALRVVREMPKWTPALDNGKPVATTYTLPIVFAGVSDKSKK